MRAETVQSRADPCVPATAHPGWLNLATRPRAEPSARFSHDGGQESEQGATSAAELVEHLRDPRVTRVDHLPPSQIAECLGSTADAEIDACQIQVEIRIEELAA